MEGMQAITMRKGKGTQVPFLKAAGGFVLRNKD